MNTVNRSKKRPPAIRYCIGSTTKKASNRLRWSPRRVWARVMNSRSAKKLRDSPKARVAPMGPDNQATQKTMAPTHRARRSRTRRWRTVAHGVDVVLARARNQADRHRGQRRAAPNSVRNSRPTCWSADQFAQAPHGLQLSHRPAAVRATASRARGPGSCACLRRRCSCTGVPKVTVHRIGTGTTSPLGMTRCTLSIHAGTRVTSGELLGQMEQAALERLRLALGAACAFREDHQRVPVAPGPRLQRLQRVLLVGALPVDVDRMEDLGGDPLLQRRRGPVVAGGDRPRRRAQFVRSAAQISTQSRWLWWLAK